MKTLICSRRILGRSLFRSKCSTRLDDDGPIDNSHPENPGDDTIFNDVQVGLKVVIFGPISFKCQILKVNENPDSYFPEIQFVGFSKNDERSRFPRKTSGEGRYKRGHIL